MATTEFIAGINLGSSKLTGMIGKKDSNGNLNVLAYAEEKSSAFIRKGFIYNLDKAVTGLTSIVNKLEMTIGENISKVYIGISGQSFCSVKNIIGRDLDNNMSITESLIDSIRDENRATHLKNLDILDVIPQEYRVDSMKHIDPVGVLGNHVEGHFLNIVARSTIIKNLKESFKQADIEIVDDPFVMPLVSANYILSENEQRAGCALVDFGADTTSVAVYRKNNLRFFSVIPLGSSNITRDLTSLNIEEDEAEELKIQYGNAYTEELKESEEDEQILLRDEETKVPLSKLNEIIQARIEEIILNVWEQIHISGCDAVLGAGLIFTGGGSNLHNLKEAFSKITKQHLKIRIAQSLFKQNIIGYTPNEDGSQISILSILLEGTQNCCKEEKINTENPKEEPIITVEEPSSEHKEEPEVIITIPNKEPLEAVPFAYNVNEKKEQEFSKPNKKEKEEKKEREKKEKEKKEKEAKKPSGWIRWIKNKGEAMFSDDEMSGKTLDEDKENNNYNQ